MIDEIETYNRLIGDYRRKLREVRDAEKGGENRSWIEFLDKERDDIHNELRRLGVEIGKSSQDITLDILQSEKDLAQYKLPEFKILRTSKAMDKITWVSVIDGEGGSRQIFTSADEYPEKISAFIPFGEQESWHLFDSENYSSRQPDEKERRRRIAKVISLMKGRVRAVEIYSGETFHRGTTLFGVACSSNDVEPLLTVMRNHRSEISIDKKFFDAQRIDEDVRDMAKEDLENILQREPDEYESRSYLIERLGKHLVDNMGLAGNVREDIRRLVADAKERAVCMEEAIESDLAGEAAVQELDAAERQYPKETVMPKTASFKRR